MSVLTSYYGKYYLRLVAFYAPIEPISEFLASIHVFIAKEILP